MKKNIYILFCVSVSCTISMLLVYLATKYGIVIRNADWMSLPDGIYRTPKWIILFGQCWPIGFLVSLLLRLFSLIANKATSTPQDAS